MLSESNVGLDSVAEETYGKIIYNKMVKFQGFV